MKFDLMTLLDLTLSYELATQKPMKKLIINNITTDHNKLTIKHFLTFKQFKSELIDVENY